jgi:cardiolipin synthase
MMELESGRTGEVRDLSGGARVASGNARVSVALERLRRLGGRPGPTGRYSEHSLWESETILFSGREFLDALLERIRSARTSVRIESYIFELDPSGRRVLEELVRAAGRGVKVRVIVDAIGSPEWDCELVDALRTKGVKAQVFGTPGSLCGTSFGFLLRGRCIAAYRALRKIQLRNHRKLAIFDGEEAIVGSANVGERFNEWRETAVILRGPGVARLRASFVRSWHFARGERAWVNPWDRTPKIRTNFLLGERRTAIRRYLADVDSAQERVWITTAYFNPRRRVLRALVGALERGVDVRLVVPRHSDVRFFPWLSRAYYAGLVERGATVYEFDGPMQHAKTTLFDRIALVGSTNLNHRSYIHDLELDVVLESPEAIATLEKLFFSDCSRSIRMSRENIRGYRPLALLASWFLMPFRRWL